MATSGVRSLTTRRDAGQERCAHPPRPGAEPQIEAGGLDLVDVESRGGGDRLLGQQLFEGLAGKDAGGVGGKGRLIQGRPKPVSAP